MRLTPEELLEHIRIRIETRRGSFLYDPEMGSELWRLQRAKNKQDVVRDADRYINDALRPEIDIGNIDSIEKVELQEQTQTGFRLRVTIAASGDKFAVQYDGLAGAVIPDEVVGC